MLRTWATLVLLLLVGGCINYEIRKDYLQSRSTPPLQLPEGVDRSLLLRQQQVPTSPAQEELQVLDPDALIRPPQIVDELQSADTQNRTPSSLSTQLKRDDNGVSYLIISADFDVSWRQIRLSLLATGFTLTDMNRKDGLFYIRYRDPEEEREEYVIQVIPAAGGSRVLVRSAEGEMLASEPAARILGLLRDNL